MYKWPATAGGGPSTASVWPRRSTAWTQTHTGQGRSAWSLPCRSLICSTSPAHWGKTVRFSCQPLILLSFYRHRLTGRGSVKRESTVHWPPVWMMSLVLGELWDSSVYLQIEDELWDDTLLDQGDCTAAPPGSCEPRSKCPVVPAHFYKLFQLGTANANGLYQFAH